MSRTPSDSQFTSIELVGGRDATSDKTGKKPDLLVHGGMCVKQPSVFDGHTTFAADVLVEETADLTVSGVSYLSNVYAYNLVVSDSVIATNFSFVDVIADNIRSSDATLNIISDHVVLNGDVSANGLYITGDCTFDGNVFGIPIPSVPAVFDAGAEPKYPIEGDDKGVWYGLNCRGNAFDASCITIGSNAHTGGSFGLALGFNCKSFVSSSISVGVAARTSSINSIVIGSNSKMDTTFQNSIAIGNGIMLNDNNNEDNSNSVAIGSMCATTGMNAITIGLNCAAGTESVSIGSGSTDNDQCFCVSIGPEAACEMTGSIAIGHRSTAAAPTSIALGTDVTSDRSGGFFVRHNAAADDDTELKMAVFRGESNELMECGLIAADDNVVISSANGSIQIGLNSEVLIARKLGLAASIGSFDTIVLEGEHPADNNYITFDLGMDSELTQFIVPSNFIVSAEVTLVGAAISTDGQQGDTFTRVDRLHVGRPPSGTDIFSQNIYLRDFASVSVFGVQYQLSGDVIRIRLDFNPADRITRWLATIKATYINLNLA